ncbi:Peptidase M20 [Acididesulfobacillus acetoxydans]|uniref:Peptidase M20 n=1 Tax=Acididesulfobacillus acetoxydans TaxID=1561005 RepID=A0A8S0X5M1_9FIRM|nr:YgeY family selenium metabolism-linked hydrolase [Acididesulfobacillus acetoxydans]CAA7601770.1 Peptidase M20 [Acididesulfobacillus acetoxydans]CEJ09011.1 Selenium metabolism hydrolase [Acididesulfobacillus acetoxydans]
MKAQVTETVNALQDQLISFASELVKIKSPTCHEEEAVKRVADEMRKLNYDQVIIDKVGNVIGVIGNGPEKLLFDSHIDNVAVNDSKAWEKDPYGGLIIDEKLYGRGSSDMKGSAAATVYAGAMIKKLGLDKGKTIYVCCSVMEEDYDGEGLYRAIVDNNLSPDYVVICEPTHLQISLGHLGRAIYKITVEGVSAHGAAPEKGVNAVYGMAKIIERVEALGNRYMQLEGERPSIALTKIESEAVSLNAIPQTCHIYLDRRMTLGENEETVAMEMDALIAGFDATWKVHDVAGTSWAGEKVNLHSFLPAWEIEKDHKLTQGCVTAYRDLFDHEPSMYKWNFSTNGVASAGKLGIPTIGFGAGIEKMAHMTNEYCPVPDIVNACKFYTLLPRYLS